MRAPIHSVKHYVQTSLATVTGNTVLTTVLVQAVKVGDINLTREVIEGAIVKAIFVELWVIGSVSNATQITVLTKFPAGMTPFSTTELAALGDADNKKNILYVTQGLASNDGIAAPIPIIRQWFKIPKSKQRFGLGDTLELQVFAQNAVDLSICGFATFKEYT